MEIIKTILRLSFFTLGCVMLMLALLVIPVGYKSFLWFFGFSVLFYLLGFRYTFFVVKYLIKKIKKLFKQKNSWKVLSDKNISYNLFNKKIRLNSKEFDFEQIKSIEIIANSKKVSVKELNRLDAIKKLEIKMGTCVKKTTYRHFKYITSKIDLKKQKLQVKLCIKDYKKLCKDLNVK